MTRLRKWFFRKGLSPRPAAAPAADASVAAARTPPRPSFQVESLESRQLLAADMTVLGNDLVIGDGDTTPGLDDFTDWGWVNVSSGTLQRTYTIRNDGDEALNLSGPEPVTLTGSADFTVLTQPSDLELAPAEETTFTISFDPSSDGIKTANIVIASDDPDENPYNFRIRSEGLAMTSVGSNLFAFIRRRGVGRTVVNFDDLTVNYTGYLTTGLKFDSSLNPGGEPFEFTIGSGQVIQGWEQGILGMRVGETRLLQIPPELAYGATGQGNIPPNATLLFEVSLLEFRYPKIVVRDINEVAISNNDKTPSDADSTDFGTITFGQTETRTFTIANEGEAPLNLTSDPKILVQGAHPDDFEVSGPTVVDNRFVFTVTFNPVTGGTRNATIVIPNDDPERSNFNFAIRGRLDAPGISVRGRNTLIANGDFEPIVGDNTDFGQRRLDTPARVRSFVIRNTGTQPLDLTGDPLVSISGPDAADFTVVTPPPRSVILPGEQVGFRIKFDPTTAGVKDAVVTIQSNDLSQGDYEFAITGLAFVRPTVRVEVINPDATELPNVPASIRISRDGDLLTGLAVKIARGGRARQVRDYIPIGNTIFLLPGEASRTVEINPISNGRRQVDRNLIIGLLRSRDYFVDDANRVVQVAIRDF